MSSQPKPTYHTPDFRTYPPERRRGEGGALLEMTLCEELVEGRWEPFVSARRVREEAV